MKKALVSCLVLVAVLLSGCGSAPASSEPVNTSLYTAIQESMVNVAVNPKTISESSIYIVNKTDAPINISIESGTYLLSHSDKTQNMLITDPKTLTLEAGKTETVSLKTACMNISRTIPKGGDKYSVEKLESDNLLIKAVDYFDKNNFGDKYGLIQAVVWLITDNANSEQMKCLRTSDRQYVIGFADYTSAVSIVNKLKTEE